MADPGTCPACGAALERWRVVAASDPVLGGQRFELCRCVRCGSAVTAAEAPDNLYAIGAYRPGDPRLYAAAAPLLRLFDRQRVALIRREWPPPARLLDAGAGRGRFVASATAGGYRASGIEASQRGADAAAFIGAAVEPVAIEEADFADGSFDVVTVWHVLEHLDDPGAALGRISRWLRPGGGLLVGVPNLGSLQARLTGGRWYHLDVPRHRVHFTGAGIRHLVGAHGFDVRRTHHLLLEHNVFGMWQSLLNRVSRRPSYVYNVLKRNAPLRSFDLALAAAAGPLLPPAALLEAAAALFGLGGTIAVVAQRR